MNVTKIDWTDRTWNPITGCNHGCWYCYAKKLTIRFPNNFPNGFEPTFYLERLEEPLHLGQPSEKEKRKEWIKKVFPHKYLIFACSIADPFAEWTPKKWLDKVLRIMEIDHHTSLGHIFQLLTKNPERIDKNYQFSDNVWIGTTVISQEDIRNIEEIKKVKAEVKFVSFEPILGKINANLKGIDWIIIGKLTGSKKIKLDRKWVDVLKNIALALDIPVFMKNNLKPDYLGRLIKDFPKVS